MGHLSSFFAGLLGALSWKNGVDNVLVGGPPTPLYLVGLTCNFLIGWFLVFLVGKAYWEASKKVGFWKAYRLVNVNARSFGSVRYALSMLMVYLFAFAFLPYYLTYRFTNGIWGYHYFTSQVVQEKKALMTNFDVSVGRGKSIYSRVEADIMFLEGDSRQIYISNSNKSLAVEMEELQNENSLYLVLIEVNEEGTVVFIK